MTKDEIRALMRERRRGRTVEASRSSSILIQRHLLASDAYRTAQSIGCYLSTETEVLTGLVFEQALADGKRIGAPQYDDASGTWTHVRMSVPSAVKPGLWKVPEPLAGEALDHMDLVIVPGRAFDRSGNRVGHGKGHYDRMLDGFTGICAGLAFDWQVLDQVPREPHDRPMDLLFTESGRVLPP